MKNFDPYEVLNISSEATEREIKKAYRALSLIWHPDKNKDPEATKTFYLLNKAYEILTDPKKRDNYIKYGSPDGPSAFSIGIALPSFLFNPKYQLIILIGFALIFLGLIPYLVFKWFKSTVQQDPSGLVPDNINYYFPYLTQVVLNPKDCPALIS